MKKIYDPRSIASKNHIVIKYKTVIDYENKIKENSKLEKKVTINNVTVFPSAEEQIAVSRKANGD